jgi:hypothetical protein
MFPMTRSRFLIPLLSTLGGAMTACGSGSPVAGPSGSTVHAPSAPTVTGVWDVSFVEIPTTAVLTPSESSGAVAGALQITGEASPVPPRGGSFRALSDLGGPWAGSLDLHGRMPVASIRLEAQASAAPWPIPRSRPPLRGLRRPAALSVVFVTERLAAEHAALPERGTAPR